MEAVEIMPDDPVETKPTQIVTRASSAPVKVNTPRAMVLAQALEEEREQRELLKRYVSDFMIEGEDYGTIPGVKKRGLFKPGAEKLMDLFRCRPEYEVMAKEVNHDTGLFYYEIRCRAVNRETDTVLNEGVGSASSYESKYRYRNAGRKCPKCGSDAIKRSKYPPRSNPDAEPGWYCFAKAGGCGAEFTADDPEIAGQPSGKVQNPDLADVANVVLKMAKKRAQVDCAIALARVSDLFTQDVEDMVTEHEEPEPTRRPPPQKKPAPPAKAQPAAAPPAPARPKAPAYVSALWAKTHKEFGETAKAEWEAAAVRALGENPKPSNEWTPEDAAAVERVLFDVPF